MGDKFFLFLLMLVILAGGVAYERYLTARDGESPVVRMIDAGGLSSSGDGQGRRITTEHRLYRVQEKMENLQASYHLINAQRAQLSQSRAAVLTQASLLSGQIVAQGEMYKDAINTEKEDFSKENHDFKALLNSLPGVVLSADPQDRAQKYQQAKARIYEELSRITGQSQEENPLFIGFFGDLEKGLATDPTWESECGGRETCVRKITDEFQSQAEDFLGRRLQQSSADINDVLAGARALEREEAVFETNLQSSEALILDSNKKIESGFSVMAKELTDVTDLRLKSLMAVYQAQREEQEIILSNLELSWQRLKSRQEVLGRALTKVRSIPGIGDLSESYDQVLVTLHANLQADIDLARDHSRESENFVAFLGGAGGQGAAAGRGRDAGSAVRNPGSSGGDALRQTGNSRGLSGQDHPGQPSLNNFSRQSIQPIKPRESLNASRSDIDNRNSSDEQMQRLRDQARDQGFYRK